MPQTLSPPEAPAKCSLGFDFIVILSHTHRLYILFQSKFYHIESVPDLIDVATCEGTITAVTCLGEILVWEFDEEKVITKKVCFTKLRVSENRSVEESGREKENGILKVSMGGNDIFLVSGIGKVYHFKRNEWYETKTYSNIEEIELSHKIIDISAGPKNNLFLSYEGLIFESSKESPLYLKPVHTKEKFIKISTNLYNAGITKKGTIMLWGSSMHGNFSEPTEFSKLTKKFIDVKLDRENGYALADDGEVWVWGNNSHGELGLSDYECRIKPFPLITLDKVNITEVFCGNSYACCVCEMENKKENNNIRIVDRKVSEFSVLRDHNKVPSNLPKNNVYNEREEYIVKNKIQEGFDFPKQMQTNNDKFDFRKSISPQKYPSEKAQKLNNILKTSKEYDNSKSNWLGSDIGNDSFIFEKRSLELEVVDLREEAARLKLRITEQNEVIFDITGKIRILEEAIDEYERTLTSRDHVLHDYQCKEHEYIGHIDELQRKIDEIVQLKDSNNEIMVVYEDLKVNFEKEREYYTSKFREYEMRLQNQEEKYLKEISSLRKSFEKPAASLSLDKENSRPKWEANPAHHYQIPIRSPSPIGRKRESPRFRGIEINNEKENSSMDLMIDQIENNKNLITKSANKLIAMLDVSQ